MKQNLSCSILVLLAVFSCLFCRPALAQNPWMVPFSQVGGGPPNTFFINTMRATVVPATTTTQSNSYAAVTDRRGYTYVGSSSNSVIAISPLTFSQVAAYTGGNINNPVGMAISPDNQYLYVTNFLNGANNGLAIFDISTPGTLVFVKTITLTGASGNPGWMDIDATGNLYIAMQGAAQWIKVTNPAGTPAITTFSTANYNGGSSSNLPGVHSIAVDKTRNLVYVSSQENAVVQTWSTAGVPQNVPYRFTSVGAAQYAHGITLSPDGSSLYVTTISTSTVYRFNTITTGLPRASGSADVTFANSSAAVAGGNARAASITPDGAKLYALGNQAVTELNPTTLATITTFTGYNTIDPHGVGAILNDYGDGPASYGKAGHSLNNANFTNGLLKIGTKVDGDSTISTTSTMANFDDNSNPTSGITDDEDAFAGTSAPAVSGANYTVTIPVLNNSGSAASLVVWVDFNHDGDFADAGETSSLLSVPSATGPQNVPVSFSGYSATPGSAFMRIRLSTDPKLTATAANARDISFWDGEVEDFPVQITTYATAPVTGMCDPSVQKERITPTTNFYDFNGTAADNNINISSITAATPTTGINQALGWTGANLTAGGATNLIWAGSNFTSFVANQNGINTIHTMTRPVADANLAGNGAVITIELGGGNGMDGTGSYVNSTPATIEIQFGGVTYAIFRTDASSGLTATATPNVPGTTIAIDGGTASPAAQNWTMYPNGGGGNPTFHSFVITLPANIPNSGNLVLRYNVNQTGVSGPSGDDYAVRKVSLLSCPTAISGNVFNDANGGTPDGPGIGGPGSATGQLYATLVDASGNVVASVPVAADGSYSLPAYANGNYTVRISTTQGTAGQAAPASGLPAGWNGTSETDGSPNLSQPVTVADANTNSTDPNLVNRNFGIDFSIDPDFNSGYINQQISGNLKTNDIGHIPATATYGTPIVPAGITNPSSSVPVINTDGTYTFTGSAPGVYTFDVPVCTGGTPNVCKNNRLTITVADPNANTNPPAANPDQATTNAGTPVTLNTLANDQPGANSAPLDPGSVAITAAPAHGTTSVDPLTGNITYTPNTGFTGTDTLKYQVCNTATPVQCTESYQVITVQPTGSPNTTGASDDYNTTAANTPVSGNVLNNDKDPEGNTQTVTGSTQNIPGVGSVSFNANGTYTFTPAAGYTGPANFPYQVCDNGTPQACTNATLYLLVTPTLPVANNDTNSTTVNTPVNGTVTGNDTCGSNTPCSYSLAPGGDPAHGTATVNPDGTYTYTPNTGYTGTDTFTYTICDAASPTPNCDTAQVVITITNPLPVALYAFEGKATGNCAVALSWKTGKEDAFSGFDIESSTDARAFNKIGELAAKGNNSNYSFEYKDAVQGKNYFRLKLKDRDGYKSNSDVVTVYVDCVAKRSIKVYPTVADHSFSIEGLLSGEIIRVTDATGRQVLSTTASQTREQLDMSSFANGTYYILVLTESKEQLSFKIVKR